MEENKVGLAPRVMAQGATGPKEYGLLVTDRRTIFVLELKSNAAIGGILGGAIGAVIASATDTRTSINYELADPGLLATMKGSVAIPHESLEHMRFKPGFGANKLQVKYRTSEGKTKKMEVMLTPPIDYVKERKAQGKKGKEAMADYMNDVQNLFRKALPLSASMKVEWSR